MAAASVKAEAALRLTTKIRERATRHVTGFEKVTAALGSRIACWAYADRGKEPGQRLPSLSERAIAEWDKRPEDWACVLSNRTGSGKTIAAARYVADRGGLILRAAETDGWGFNAQSQIMHYAAADLLMVDDMGLEQNISASGHIAAITALRSSRWAKTVYTTTLALTGATGSILALYGEATESRLRAHHHNLASRGEPDRRGKLMPVMAGFINEQQIAHFAESVRYVAAGLIEEEFGLAEVERFAMFAGLKLDSQEMRDTVAVIEQEWSERSADAARLLAALAGPGVIGVDAYRREHPEDDDLVGWATVDEPTVARDEATA